MSITLEEINERIQTFCSKFEHGKKYPLSEFLPAYRRATDECGIGSAKFIAERHFTMETEFTIDEWLFIVRNEFRPNFIKKLIEAWRDKQ